MITTQLYFFVEPFREFYDEATALFVAHWNEIAKNKSLLRLNPDEKVYEDLEAQKKLLVVTARDDGNGGRLVGYCVWFLVNHPHYKQVRVAEEDLHFLLPEYRRDGNGYRFLRAACDAAFAHGADILTMREKIGHEHPVLMRRLGFVPTDIVHTLTKEKKGSG